MSPVAAASGTAAQSVPPPAPPRNARPLKPTAKLLLILSASATILLGYSFSLVAMLLLLVVILCELAVGLLLARFGLLGFVAPLIQRHFDIFKLFAASFWLHEGENCRVPIEREEAPRLFALLDSLAGRLGITAPREVVVEMNVGAWVELRGWRQGSRATRLGLGYDLLAGLNDAEAEAVLAHEMVHAKLVRRGLKRWLNRGLARLGTLAGGLSARKDSLRRDKKSCVVGDAALSGADANARLAARLVAAYSRQDEFEADRGAAELCGSAHLRSALGKLHELAEKTGRLGWHERVAKLQLGDGYAAWLLSEIAAEQITRSPDEADVETDPYSSHPSIRDRLAALPAADALPAATSTEPSGCALDLVLKPDLLADRLVAAIETFSAKLEARDDNQLKGLARKIRSGAETGPLQALGLFVLIGSVFALFFAFAEGAHPALFLASAGGVALGVWLYRLGRYNRELGFPTPAFATIRAGLDKLAACPDLGAEEKRLEQELKDAAKDSSAKKHREALYRARAFAALERCDYLEAHVAARLGLAADDKSVACSLAFTVAAGSLRQEDLVGQNLRFIRARSALRTADTLWGSAWALFLLNDFASAEALLVDLQKLRPDDAQLRLLLAACADHRGKRQTALGRAREAVTLAGEDVDAQQFLVGLLLDGGYVREARERVATLSATMLAHPDFRLHRLRLHLMRGEAEAVHRLEESMLAEAPDDASLRIQLALAHESVRRHQRARDLYEEVTRLGHHPAARLGLGRLAARRGETEDARRHFLATLDTQTKLGTKAAPPLSLFVPVLAGLAGLRGAPRPCHAWIATFTGNAAAGPLANQRLLVFARDEPDARTDAQTIANAILPVNELQPTHLTLTTAPKDRQPVGAVLPGVQGLWE